MNGTLTDVAGLTAGHGTDGDAATACTAVLAGGSAFGLDAVRSATGLAGLLPAAECLAGA